MIRFHFTDVEDFQTWWLVVEDDEVDVCIHDPGKEVDVYINVDLQPRVRGARHGVPDAGDERVHEEAVDGEGGVVVLGADGVDGAGRGHEVRLGDLLGLAQGENGDWERKGFF